MGICSNYDEQAKKNFGISKKQMEMILQQMGNCICKIECNNGSCGTGFFCKIPQNNGTNLKVLITNNHVLTSQDILVGKKFRISLDNESKFFIISIQESRITYTIEKPYDVTFIEIKDNDGINENSFLEIDDNLLLEENDLRNYSKNPIYLLHYPGGKEVKYSIGIIKGISLDTYDINHDCETYEGSSGAPIINLNNHKIIGLHKGGGNNKKYNFGTFLKDPIKNFINYIILNKNKFSKQIIKIPDDSINTFEDYKFISTQQMEIIINQAKNKIFLIKYKGRYKGSGFFCNIPSKILDNKLSVFITCFHCLDEDLNIKEIQITSNIFKKTIIINENRKFFIDKENDVTIIEIKPSDSIDSDLFLEIDENIFFLNNDKIKNLAIYLLRIDINGMSGYSNGVIKNKYDNQIEYMSESKDGSSGSPIMNLSNFKVIGIHKGRNTEFNYKYGILIQSSIEKYKSIFHY